MTGPVSFRATEQRLDALALFEAAYLNQSLPDVQLIMDGADLGFLLGGAIAVIDGVVHAYSTATGVPPETIVGYLRRVYLETQGAVS